MRVVVQRVASASVEIEGVTVGAIDRGVLLLVGIDVTDGLPDVDAAVTKLVGLRIFEDADRKMNLSLSDVAGSALVVSQFTLLGDIRRGRRPSFTRAARPSSARPLLEAFVEKLRANRIETATGVFGASMHVASVNDGPVTIILETDAGRVL